MKKTTKLEREFDYEAFAEDLINGIMEDVVVKGRCLDENCNKYPEFYDRVKTKEWVIMMLRKVIK